MSTKDSNAKKAVVSITARKNHTPQQLYQGNTGPDYNMAAIDPVCEISDIRISVVCPTFNSANFINETLETVIIQSAHVEELIVSDDGSLDDTVNRVQLLFDQYKDRGSVQCQLIKNTHCGPGVARNTGIMAAQGDWIAFLDSDDKWFPDKIQHVIEVIKEYPEVNFICHNELKAGHKGRQIIMDYAHRYKQGRSLTKQLYYHNLFSTSAVVCRRSLLMEHGLFDTNLMSAQDYELWLRLSAYIKPYFITKILGQYIERKGNITSSSLMKRFKNELIIAHRYHKSVPVYIKIARILRITLSYLRQLVNRMTSM